MPDNLLNDVPTPDLIVRTPLARKSFHGLNWRDRELFELNALEANFENCDFRYCIIENCYLRRAKFINCRFDGAKFIDCNLKNAVFINCDMKYVLLHRTLVDPKEIVSALPGEPNIRRDALQNLRANAAETGDFGSMGFLVLEEIEATKKHLHYASIAYSGYYRDKYPRFIDRLTARFNRWILIIEGMIWGHGERPERLLFSCSLILLCVALVNLWSVVPRTGWNEAGAGIYVFRYVVDLFLDMPTDERFRGWWILDYFVVGIRYVYIGLFVSVLLKTISHR